MKRLLAAVLFTCIACSAFAQEPPAQPNPTAQAKKKQFAYVLKLVPRLLEEKNWTKQDEQLVGAHFNRLKGLHAQGKVVFAGRTLNESEPSQFGIVVLQVDTEEEARRIMEEDDGVKGGIMTAELFPFGVALQ